MAKIRTTTSLSFENAEYLDMIAHHLLSTKKIKIIDINRSRILSEVILDYVDRHQLDTPLEEETTTTLQAPKPRALKTKKAA